MQKLYTETSNRLVYLEFLRIIAIYAVMFNHAGVDGFFLFSVIYSSFKQWVYLFISIFNKIAGTLLLVKQESIKEVCEK